MPLADYPSSIEEIVEVARSGRRLIVVDDESYGLRVVEYRHLRGEGA